MMKKEKYTALDYINDAIDITNQRAMEKPDFRVFQVALKQLMYVKKILTGEEKDKSVLHSMNLGSLASKEFDTTDPELAKHLSNANYIASQIGAGLKVILPHQIDPEYEKRKKRYLKVQ
ncbi:MULTISPECIES: immunity protein Tsi6 family protein [Pantoea]|jgi:hypothetical protein|uniref:Tsi6 domain-containing protein n=1 Tax=Pantoea eucalypti TaxID=470933 RepID=A0ABY2ZCR2_9GAMM|nr:MULTISPECIES: immunity protein Tsi6 family protein [Pantoea]PQL26176.1 hypothetical protein C5L22_21910 [Pantoea ananatis]EFM17502.1 hypothetical protein PanABDRAFT_4476 [Pantoea sp. aB]MCD2359028.1 immunity protein Tsi6 family protein [Pantoea sp. MHSD4]QGF27382.1 hypothetical protein EE896_11325 [Pantoea eucalypti]TPV29762.1 hypothetical protein FJW02_20960 [Pantoea eucalypti]